MKIKMNNKSKNGEQRFQVEDEKLLTYLQKNAPAVPEISGQLEKMIFLSIKNHAFNIKIKKEQKNKNHKNYFRFAFAFSLTASLAFFSYQHQYLNLSILGKYQKERRQYNEVAFSHSELANFVESSWAGTFKDEIDRADEYMLSELD